MALQYEYESRAGEKKYQYEYSYWRVHAEWQLVNVCIVVVEYKIPSRPTILTERVQYAAHAEHMIYYYELL